MSTNRKKRRRKVVDPVESGRRRVHRAALAYLEAGLSFIPISADQTKQPAFELLPKVPSENGGRPRGRWSIFRERQPAVKEVSRWFSDWSSGCEYGLAIIGGRISGGLEIIDIDTIDLVEPWARAVQERCPGLIDRLVRVQTPRPGMHVYFRCEAAAGNCKLARTATRSPGEEKWKPKTVIEVKGEGGYCLAPPSPAACHPTGRCYEFVGDLDLTMVPNITPEERQVLFDTARQLDTWGETQAKQRRRLRRTRSRCRGKRPGDDFNERADWAEILEPHGWQLVGDDGDEVDYWRRPGKDFGQSATTNYEGSDLLYVFSTNADPFEDETSYTKFHAYTLLEHDDDFHAAAKALREKGFGSRLRGGRKSGRKNPYLECRLHSQNRRSQETKKHGK